MFQTSAKDIRKPFLTILGTFWTLLRDIEAILQKEAHPPLKKIPYVDKSFFLPLSVNSSCKKCFPDSQTKIEHVSFSAGDRPDQTSGRKRDTDEK